MLYEVITRLLEQVANESYRARHDADAAAYAPVEAHFAGQRAERAGCIERQGFAGSYNFV